MTKWPTPTVTNAAYTSQASKRKYKSGPTLQEAVNTWPTPTAHLKDMDTMERARFSRTKLKQSGGMLNPAWVEWLMNWPIGWTSLDPLPREYLDDWKQRTQGCTTNVRGKRMRNMWWDNDPSETPYRPRSNEQLVRQCADPMSRMPHDHSHAGWRLGARSDSDCTMRSMREGVPAQAKQAQRPLQESRMRTRMGQVECDETLVPRVAEGIENRVGRLAALGNGQVPAVVAVVWKLLTQRCGAVSR